MFAAWIYNTRIRDLDCSQVTIALPLPGVEVAGRAAMWWRPLRLTD